VQARQLRLVRTNRRLEVLDPVVDVAGAGLEARLELGAVLLQKGRETGVMSNRIEGRAPFERRVLLTHVRSAREATRVWSQARSTRQLNLLY